jgi:hypothetical protein
MPVNTRIQLRRGTAAAGDTQWTNQVLYAGEIGIESDTGKFKIGDGTTAWNSLGYASVLPSDLDELVEDIIGSHVVAGSGISVSYNDTNGNTTVSLSDPTIQASDVTDFSEAVDDRVSNLLVAGNNITLTYDDNANTLTVAAGGTSTEDVQDIIGSAVVAGSGISVTYNDGAGTTTIALSDPTIQVADITDLTASAAELNTLDGITASTSELNILDGVTASASELNLVDGSTANTVVNGKAVIYGSSGEVSVTSLSIAGTGVTASATELNILDGATLSTAELNILDGVTSSTAELNILDGVTADSTEINLLDGATANTVVNSKVVVYGSAGEVSASSISTTGNVTVGGNLIVNGSTTTVNSTVTTIDDPILTLGGDTAPSSDDSKDRGVEFRYYSGSAKVGFFGYDNSTGKFTFIPDATNTSEAFTGTIGEIDAKIDWSNVNSKPDPVIAVDVTGDVVGSGNLTMTDLAGGTISISTTIQANSVALGTDTTGNYVASVAVSGVGLSVSGSGENATYTVTSNATSDNTNSTIVARDSSGNFSAGTITATLSGTATNASNIEVDTSSTNINHVVFVYGTDGNLKPSVNSNLRFDAANNELLGDDNSTPTTKLKYFIIDGGTP